MSDYIKKIRTESGDMSIDYNALENLPVSDKTLSKDGCFADAKVVGNKIVQIKKDLNVLNVSDCELSLTFIKNSYYKQDGTYEEYGGWERTPLIKLPKTDKLHFEQTDTNLSKYNCFYDANRNLISTFSIQKGYYNDSVDVPSNAVFVGFSGLNVLMESLKVTYTEKGVDVTRRKIGANTRLRVCSFNVGLWTDGVSSNARVADEDVEEASITLRRFIGDVDADLILCEEAPHEFNKSMTIDAYDYCFKNNLPFGWKTTEGGNIRYVRQMLFASKFEMKNIKPHEYKCDSARGYAIFDLFINDKCVTFIVCHLSGEDGSDGIRQQEMAELKTVMRDYEYCVLCGDFNAFSIDEFTTHFGVFNLSNHGYFGDYNTWPVEGWLTWNHCLDNIITTKNITIQNVYMGDVNMSDHKPLVAELLIK